MAYQTQTLEIVSPGGGSIANSALWIMLISFALVSTVVGTLLFIVRKENWMTALFLTAAFIGLLLTILNASALPSNLRERSFWSWLCFMPAAAGVLLYFYTKRRRLASALAVLTILLSLAGAFLP